MPRQNISPSHLAQPLERDSSLYRLTPDASGGKWDLLQVSREFDSSPGDLNDALIQRLNEWALTEPSLADLHLDSNGWSRLPEEILLLDGSPSRLPLAAESARIMSAHMAEKNLSIPIRVVNRREELLARTARSPRDILVLSQAAQRSLYDAPLAEALINRGVVTVPGPLTAPGGPLSNKKTTYQLLNGETAGTANMPRLTARYEEIDIEGNGPLEAADAILDAATRLQGTWNTSTFFVKPQEGGGGRGVFRIDLFPEGFTLPDLSRLGVESERALPLPLSIDANSNNHLQALHWLIHRFSASPATANAYLHSVNSFPLSKGGSMSVFLSRLVKECGPRLRARIEEEAEKREKIRNRLARAIENYEQLFGVRYNPLICDWIDFGLFSVRAHLRLSRLGPILETLYARLFPIEFTETSVGVIGVDSITNRTEGGMEFNRYAPLVPALVEFAGGADALCQRIQGAFYAFSRFASLLSPEERSRVPLRAEFDISPLSGLIAEGNADPVRAQCANSRWRRFRTNTQAWAEDALSYFSWKFHNN